MGKMIRINRENIEWRLRKILGIGDISDDLVIKVIRKIAEIKKKYSQSGIDKITLFTPLGKVAYRFELDYRNIKKTLFVTRGKFARTTIVDEDEISYLDTKRIILDDSLDIKKNLPQIMKASILLEFFKNTKECFKINNTDILKQDLDKMLRSEEKIELMDIMKTPEEMMLLLQTFGFGEKIDKCNELFEKALQEQKIDKRPAPAGRYMCDFDILKIIAVFEEKEKPYTRIAFCVKVNAGEIDRGIIFAIISRPSGVAYNFLDCGNYIISGSNFYYAFYNFDWLVVPFDINDEKNVPKEYLNIALKILEEWYYNNDGSRPLRIRKEDFDKKLNGMVSAIKIRVEKNKRQKTAVHVFQNKLVEGVFNVGELQFNNDRITYQSKTIGIEGAPLYKWLNGRFIMEKGEDFNAYFQRLLDTIYCGFINIQYANSLDDLHKDEIYVRDELIGKKILLGSFPVVITKEKKNGKTFHLINGVAISQRELKDVLCRALTFQDEQSYNSFLKVVKRHTLTAHKFLTDGLKISQKIYDPKTRGEIIQTVLFKVRRDGVRYVISAGSKENKNYVEATIKGGIATMLKMSSDNYWLDNLGEDIDEGDARAKELISIGTIEFIDTMKRAKELLQSVLEKYPEKVKQIEIQHDGKKKSGIWVKGRIREYFIDLENAGVYDYEGGEIRQYRCIVDQGIGAELNVYDRIITRIYSLMNDRFIVDRVTTLK